jgi:hypothetical protein
VPVHGIYVSPDGRPCLQVWGQVHPGSKPLGKPRSQTYLLGRGAGGAAGGTLNVEIGARYCAGRKAKLWSAGAMAPLWRARKRRHAADSPKSPARRGTR